MHPTHIFDPNPNTPDPYLPRPLELTGLPKRFLKCACVSFPLFHFVKANQHMISDAICHSQKSTQHKVLIQISSIIRSDDFYFAVKLCCHSHTKILQDCRGIRLALNQKSPSCSAAIIHYSKKVPVHTLCDFSIWPPYVHID